MLDYWTLTECDKKYLIATKTVFYFQVVQQNTQEVQHKFFFQAPCGFWLRRCAWRTVVALPCPVAHIVATKNELPSYAKNFRTVKGVVGKVKICSMEKCEQKHNSIG